MMKFLNNKIILLSLFFISFFVSAFLNFEKIKVPYFRSVYKDVQIDISFKNPNFKVFFDDREVNSGVKIDDNHKMFLEKNAKLVKKITLENSENIEKVMVFVGNDVQFPAKFNEINIDNKKSPLDIFSIVILSFFYNYKLYLFSYLFLFLFLYNFKGKINHNVVFCSILILGFLLRISQMNAIPFWDDEVYILSHTEKFSPLIMLFNDPGNPPLYFILFKIYRSIVDIPEVYRFSSVVLGLVFNVCFYIYLKFWLGKAKALIGFLAVTLCLVLIYFSQEIRCYMLMMILCVLNSFFFFKFKNNKKQYLISVVALLYTHYFGAFFVLYNFICGAFLFFKNKNKLKSFVLTNILACLIFLPMIVYKFSILSSDFNSWMKAPDIVSIKLSIDVFSENFFFLIIFAIGLMVVFFKSKSKKEKLLINYHFWAIVFLFFISILFSNFVRPIFCYRYFYVVFPSYLALVVFMGTYNYKTRFKIFLQFLIFIAMLTLSKINYQNLFCNHTLFLKFIENDKNKKENVYVFMSDTVQEYKKYNIKNAKMIYLPVNQGIGDINIDDYNLKKPYSAYVLNLYLEYDNFKNNKIDVYKTPLGVFSKITSK